MTTYEEFQDQSASEKIGLATIEAAERLVGWVLDSGTLFKLDTFSVVLIVSIEEDGTTLTSVASKAAVTPGTFFHDKALKTLFLEATDSTNPNGKFTAMTQKFFFSVQGVNLANDLASGFDVHWAPGVLEGSMFGVKLDNINQLGVAIEGSGSFTLRNDQSFWLSRFDKLFFENKKVELFSWNRDLAASEAQIIYRGRVQKKGFSPTRITFGLKDFLNELRQPVPLSDIESIAGSSVPESLNAAKIRLAYGEPKGIRPTNTNQILESGASLTGTFAVAASTTVTGTGTLFLTELSPEDQITIDGVADALTIQTISSDTSLLVTQAPVETVTGKTATFIPNLPRRDRNRIFQVADHMKEPATTVTAESLSTLLPSVADSTDFNAGDTVLIGGEQRIIRRVVLGTGGSDDRLRLTLSLNVVPTVGTVVLRLSVFNAFITHDDGSSDQLVHTRDYVYDANTGVMTLDDLAEFNLANQRKLNGTISIAGRVVTGVGTQFTKQLSPNSFIRNTTSTDFFEVLQITSDTALDLRTAGPTIGGEVAFFKSPKVFEEGKSVLSCDILGGTDDGTKTGVFLNKPPQIVKDLLTRVGLLSELDVPSFTAAEGLSTEQLGIMIPDGFTATKAPTVRSITDGINRSVFGALVQDEEFKLQYKVISPERDGDEIRFKEEDILRFSIQADSKRIIRKAIIEHERREFDRELRDRGAKFVSATSDIATRLVKTANEKNIRTYLVDASEAATFAARWVFLFEIATSVISIRTKMRAHKLQVTDRIDISHQKFYERVGSTENRKIGFISSIQKGFGGSSILLEDLANALSRCATITVNTANDFDSSTVDEKFSQGYITDAFGMIDNDRETFGINLIW